MENILQVLQDYGLLENEGKVFLAGLMLGSATANDIAYRAGLLRTTTYEILKRLHEKGLVAQYDKDNIKYFDVVDPSILLQHLEEKTNKLKHIMKDLEKMKETIAKRPNVEFFSGFKGIKSLLELQLEEKDNINIMGKIELSNRLLGPYREQYIRKRIEKKLKMNVLCEPSKEAEEFKKSDAVKLRKTQTKDFCKDMKATFVTFGDKLAIISFLREDPVGVLIQDKNIKDAFQVIFREFWKTSR